MLYTMIFLHIVDDFYLQGILGKLKQKIWWNEELNKLSDSIEGFDKEKYKYDYLVALFMHSFSWTFMIMLPTLFVIKEATTLWYLLFVVNCVIHFIVDDLKANEFKINLITDQSIHILQIMLTYITVNNYII